MRISFSKASLLIAASVLFAACAYGQTCTYGLIDHTAPELWKHQLCPAPTFITAPLSFSAAGSYPAQYLGKLQGGYLNSSASVSATLLGAASGVTLSNLNISSTPPPSAPQGDRGHYIYGDVTISTPVSGTLGLMMNIAQEGVQILTVVDALSIQSAPQTTCQQDVSAQVLVTSTQPVRLFGTQLYTQVVTLKNVGGANINGPLLIALGNLSANAQLFAGNGKLSCGANAGSPYQYAGSGLAAGASTRVVLTFTNSLVPQANVVYQPIILAASQQSS